MECVDEFHKWYEESRTWEQTKWLGVPMWKNPMDCLVIQELIYKVRPDWIIETGTGLGGSSVFYASLFELIGHGNVITVDIDESKQEWNKCDNKNVLSRIKFIRADTSLDPDVPNTINHFVKDHDRSMVILDSWHSYDHVVKELEMYYHYVSRNSYLIVEDTHVSGHPIEWKWGKGPYEAVQDFLKKHPNFEADQECEKHLLTFNPHGFLRRVK